MVQMDELLNQYADRFNDNFPIFLLRNKTEDEIKEIVQSCLDKNEPLSIEVENDCDY